MRISDWSSDVCSSDLAVRCPARRCGRAWPAALGGCTALAAAADRRQPGGAGLRAGAPAGAVVRLRQDRKSVVEGKSGSVRVDFGGRSRIKKRIGHDGSSILTANNEQTQRTKRN